MISVAVAHDTQKSIAWLSHEAMTFLYLTVAAVAYLLGSIPFGYLLVRYLRGEDIRLSGSGNIGATNVVRSGAKGLGIATLFLDALKGLLAVWIASALAHSSYNACGDGECIAPAKLMSIAALAAVLGHVFPVWLKFKGGKGVATAVGVFVLLYPLALLIALAMFVVIVAVSRYVSLGSILACVAFPLAAYFLEHPEAAALLPVCAISALIIFKHGQNIRRLIAGNENRFGRKKDAVIERQA